MYVVTFSCVDEGHLVSRVTLDYSGGKVED